MLSKLPQEDYEAAFNEAYASLNAAQKQAVDTIDGPVMVIAGPGTGKTQILTLRIANILRQTDVGPEAILALTFTESGAAAMRERLRRFIGVTAYQVTITTFHSFANSLISRYPDSYARIIGGRLISDIEQIELLESIIDTSDLRLLRPPGNPTYYVSAVRSMIASLKQEYITPDALAERLVTQESALNDIQQFHETGAHKGKERGEYTNALRSLNKNRELLLIYRNYEAALCDARLYDYADMIGQTIVALEGDELMLRELQEHYQYVLADEHQDVNGSQNRILELLCNFHERPNIFVVGDEKQAIYRFQGASLQNFLYFTDVFPEAATISLTENYRSGQFILDYAQALIETDDQDLAKLRVPLTARAVSDSKIEVRGFEHEAVEHAWLAADIKDQLAALVRASEIAIIVRRNQEVETLARELRAAGIAVQPSAESDILQHPITHLVMALLRAIVEHSDQAALFSLLHAPYLGLSAEDRFRILSARSNERSLFWLLENPHDIAGLSNAGKEELIALKTHLDAWRASDGVLPLPSLLERILHKSGLYHHVLAHEPGESIRVLRRLYDEVTLLAGAERGTSLRDITRALSQRMAHNIPLTAPFIGNRGDAVQIMTAHKAKGLEFSLVYLPHAVDAIWGGGRNANAFSIPQQYQTSARDTAEDEERLWYVALTRAKLQIKISHAETNASSRSFTPSRLLSEANESLVVQCDTESFARDFVPAINHDSSSIDELLDPALLREMLVARGLSATALNNYLQNPWQFMYRNMLRVPEMQSISQQYGTAIHAVLEALARAVRNEGALPSESQIIEALTRELKRLPLEPTMYTQLHEKGLTALLAYRAKVEHDWPSVTKEEHKIRVPFATGVAECPEIQLTGLLDRIDCHDAGEAIRVVDYKTGKPKTRNDIEGKTKQSSGDYKRQLVFYALLLSLQDDERLKTRTMSLVFVEPTARGEIKEETFVITDEEIDVLREEIRAMVQAVVSGEILQCECDPVTCEYCELVSAWQQKRT